MAGAILASCVAMVPTHAQSVGGVHPALTKFVGQIVTVQSGKDGAPSLFTLRIARRLVDFRLTAQARLVAKSAEAAVEGFVADDYAVVMARHVNRQWLAYRVDFDVQPFLGVAPVTITVAGTVVTESATGKAFTMTLNTGDMRLVQIVKQTKFRIDGQLLANPTVLMKGDMVKVVMRRSGRVWIAVDINLQSAPLRA